jgi:hypothetical protein
VVMDACGALFQGVTVSPSFCYSHLRVRAVAASPRAKGNKKAQSHHPAPTAQEWLLNRWT